MRDLSVALLQAVDLVQPFDTVQCPEAEHDRLAQVLRELPARVLAEPDLRHDEVRVLEERARAVEAVHVDAADQLDLDVGRAERPQPLEILVRHRLHEAVDQRGRGQRPGGRRAAVGLLQPPAAALQRGLHRADGGLQERRALLERQVEHVLQQHGRALARRQLGEQLGRGFAHLARARRIARALRLGRAFPFALAPLHLQHLALARRRRSRRSRSVSPCAPGRRAGSRAGEIGVELPHQSEDPQQGLLHQVLAVPDVSGELHAVAMDRGPERRQLVQIAAPGYADVGLDREGGFGFGHVSRAPVGVLTTKTNGAAKKKRG